MKSTKKEKLTKYKTQNFSLEMCDEMNKFLPKQIGKRNILKLYNLDELGKYFTVSDNCMQYIANSKW